MHHLDKWEEMYQFQFRYEKQWQELPHMKQSKACLSGLFESVRVLPNHSSHAG